MAKKIGVITTGGTIGSILSGDAMAVDPRGEGVRREIQLLCEQYGFDVEVRSAFNKNSEDLTPEDWGTLIQAVQDMIADGIDRVVITHGTDTLAYSAAALGLVFRNQGIRLCLTGSFYALEADGSDGPLNLLAAFHAVSNDAIPQGVYVAFRQDASNDCAVIHDALAVKPMGFDDDAFSSVAQKFVAVISREGQLDVVRDVLQMSVPELSDLALAPKKLNQAAQDILYMEHYPGLPWQRIDHTDLTLLLVGLYHSGTADASTGPGALLLFLQNKPRDLAVIGATFPADVITVPYESTAKLIANGMHMIKDLPIHVVYVFAVLESAAGQSIEVTLKKLSPWLMADKRS